MSAKYKSPRKAISARTEQAVLAKSRRRCTLCFGISGDRKEKHGQIAHLDGNRGNNAESNLAWMCLDHHSLFDSTTKQHKNYTIGEVKEYRKQLYKALRSTSPRSSGRSGRRRRPVPKLKTPNNSAQDSVKSCDLWLEFDPNGSCPLRIQNNGTEPVYDVVVHIPADGSGFKSDVMNRLDNDRRWVSCSSRGDFVYQKSVRAVLVETILRETTDGAHVQESPVLITYRTRTKEHYECRLEIRLPLRGGIQFALPNKVERRRSRQNSTASLTTRKAIVTHSPVASGTGITQTINSPTINVSVAERASGTSTPVQFFNWNGSSESLNVNGRQHSVQDPSLLDLWCLVTIVNCTLYPVKIEPLQLVINGEECPPKHIFFRPKSNLRERFKRISVMGNNKEDYQLHFMFPVDSCPNASSGYLLVETHSGHDPVKIEVKFP